ncbi:MAG: hypothetical protein HFF26_10585 [Oscillospiraceae bacterium]|nr:hypothetical protein [Oscillospiraceae bacterium]
MSWYYNPAGQRRALYDRPLEPPDCWQEGADNEEEEFDRWEAEAPTSRRNDSGHKSNLKEA